MPTIEDRFLLRGGLKAALLALNEVPLRRELVVELDNLWTTGELAAKIGDGSTHYTSLPYLQMGGGNSGSIVLSTSGSLTLSAAAHLGRMLLHAGGAITLPPTAAAGFSVNDVVEVRRQTGTAVTFVAGSGVTLDFNTTLYRATINAEKDVVALKVVAVDTWALLGPLADA